jgi:CBS domain-containing protein
MKVEDVMVRDIVTIEASATLLDAATRMRNANVGVLPVTANGEMRGVVTDRDLVVRGMAGRLDPSSTRVAECATPEPRCARPDWGVDDALEVMAQEQIGRLPVLDEDDHLVGIVTLGSLALRSRAEKEALEAAKAVSRRSAKGLTTPPKKRGPEPRRTRDTRRTLRRAS